MPAWFLFVCFLHVIFGTCEGLLFNVSRGVQNVGLQDLFSNLDPSANCPNKWPFPDAGKPWCQARKGGCSDQGCCVCKCEYPSATFRMNVNPYLGTCVGNSDIRVFAGCTNLFATEAKGHPLATLDLSVLGSKGIPYLPDKYWCKVKSAEYLDIVTWKQLPKKETDTFSIRRTKMWYKNELTWTGALTSSYFGYIMKIKWECRRGHRSQNGCVVLKTKGTLSWTVPNPTTQVPPVTTTLPTTTKTPTTASTRKVTTQVESTTQVRLTTRKTSMATSLSSTLGSTSTVTEAMSSSEVPSSKRTTTKTATSRPSLTSQKTSYTTSHIVTEISTEPPITTEALPTDSTAGDVTTIEPTSRSVGSRKPNKDGNKLSGEKEEDSMMVAIVAGVAAVICVAVVLLCVWLIISQRRKHRHGASYGTGTTVIANPTTSSQNHFPMPGLLKNPVCDNNDSVYTEPEDRVHKSAVGLLGTPSYETCNDLLLKNPGAKDSRSIPLNNIQKKPLNTANRYARTKDNAYDCTDLRTNHGGKPEGEKSIYQSLVTEKEARARFKPEVNVATYQSLNPDGLMYQPLMLNKRQDEGPEYLALLNPSDSTGNIYTSPPEYQPPYSTGPPPADVEESPEYADYADLDELEEISANEASNRSSDQEPSYSAPLYNVLEGPSYDYASAPMYDVLEGPDPYSVGSTNLGFEQPMYEVLEGPDTN